MVIPTGIGLSILAAFLKATKSITTKVSTTTTGVYLTSWSFRFISFLFFTVLVLITRELYTPTTPTFWIALIVNIAALSATTLLITKAFSVSEISIVSPLMALIPVAVVLPAWVLLQETPTPMAGAGILLITFGTYLLETRAHRSENESLFTPFLRLKDDPAAKYIALMLLIVGFIPSVDKIGITESSPLFWVACTHLGLSLVLGYVMSSKEPNWKPDFKANWKPLFALGIANALLWIAQAYAYELTQVAYVQAIKRGSILIAIIAGHFLYNETNIRNRLLGAFIILLGITAIVLGA